MGCRGTGDKSELLRFVRSDGLLWDQSGVLPGRGAYLHPSLDCLNRAERSKAFTRALRLPQHEPLDDIRAMLLVGTHPEGAQDEHPMNGQP